MVRAKFKVTSIKRTIGSTPDGFDEDGRQKWRESEKWTIEASPVHGNGDPEHENTKFWQASPSGSFVLGTVNHEAVEQFTLGGEFYMDMSPAG